ncbi:hypothetical protein M7I_0912 [Glarea lozoyensis 74030]|uniref:Uncharacterized protein n=1 Tax=Glarea lozoyensis (strain ATCC 74030 / MF5533) TaxID=1104152 RepID=H0EEN2_GLAL7|nr:hypothetical protein M7I_0912 [Glarea lozoyensis 74030]
MNLHLISKLTLAFVKARKWKAVSAIWGARNKIMWGVRSKRRMVDKEGEEELNRCLNA